MEKKGQGALEYLLLIGGAVLIAVIVIAVVTGMANNTKTGIQKGAYCASLTGCNACYAASTGDCAGFKTDGNRIFTSQGSGTCPDSNSNAFGFCKAA